MGYSSIDIKERMQWTFPIVFSPLDPNVLYATSQHVWRTTNEGASWERISPDLTRADPKTLGPSGGPITLDQTGVETYATVFTLAPSPLEAGTIWAGSDDGLIHVTRDGGRSWQNVTPPDLPEFARVSLIEASPHAPATAYVAANRYQRADRAPYVFKTTDYGQTWTRITGGLPADDFARAIREDTVRAGLLFLGTETGVYVSFDAGANWQSLRLKLPVTPVHDLAIRNADVVIATHGRSFYVLDNISVLRQLDPGVAASAAHLFDPADATRSVSRGVAIDYYLKEAADKVTIDILNAQRRVIRSFTRTAEEEKKEQEKTEQEKKKGQPEEEEDEEESFFRGGPPPRVGLKAGMNRFTWDMRYPNAVEFPNLILWAGSTRGPLAPPAAYAVRLTVGEHSQTQPFNVVRNPAGSATDADLMEQFTLASQITDRLSAANGAVVRLRSLKEQIKNRLDQTSDARIKRAGADLANRLTGIEGEIYQHRNRSSQDPLNFPIRLNNKLASLKSVVESGDARPTDQAYAVFKELSARLDRELARVDTAVATEVAAFNRLLRARRLDPVTDAPPSAARETEPSR
jgi:hypothetical protein